MTVIVPQGYRERERRGLERAQRRIGNPTEDMRAQREALLAEKAREIAGLEPISEAPEAPVDHVEPSTETDPASQTPAEQDGVPAAPETDPAKPTVHKTRKPKA